VKVAAADAPSLSTAVHVTIVAPSAKVPPDAGAQRGVSEPSSASVAVAVNVTVAPAGLVASAIIAAGPVTDGRVFGGSATANGDSVVTTPQIRLVLRTVVTSIHAPDSK